MPLVIGGATCDKFVIDGVEMDKVYVDGVLVFSGGFDFKTIINKGHKFVPGADGWYSNYYGYMANNYGSIDNPVVQGLFTYIRVHIRAKLGESAHYWIDIGGIKAPPGTKASDFEKVIITGDPDGSHPLTVESKQTDPLGFADILIGGATGSSWGNLFVLANKIPIRVQYIKKA